MNLSDDQIKEVNGTARNSSRFVEQAVIPKLVEEMAKPDWRILDYGSGPKALHVHRLRDLGFNVTAHDFGNNITTEHDPEALTRTYDLVYASNVINVQISHEMLRSTLVEISTLLDLGGVFLFNLPKEPQKIDFDIQDLVLTLSEIFGDNIDYRKRNSSWIFTIKKGT
ncbi:hypothetical protein CMI47_11105 [Candidatus Pacearchaeota archaeon]|jgi:hypothetical protein|nr:hypothetical protein [Candidatus Pacearchaeota archaeon]|tara:strand:+ start:4035 stop:4538 length:504 start_codon:yes stop_codon:yes gene_type:complete